MIVVGVLASLLLGSAAALVVVRMVLGPTTLDRVVSLDMLVAVIVCGVGAYAAVTGSSASVPVLVVVALLGFLGSVAVARFFGRGSM